MYPGKKERRTCHTHTPARARLDRGRGPYLGCDIFFVWQPCMAGHRMVCPTTTHVSTQASARFMSPKTPPPPSDAIAGMATAPFLALRWPEAAECAGPVPCRARCGSRSPPPPAPAGTEGSVAPRQLGGGSAGHLELQCMHALHALQPAVRGVCSVDLVSGPGSACRVRVVDRSIVSRRFSLLRTTAAAAGCRGHAFQTAARPTRGAVRHNGPLAWPVRRACASAACEQQSIPVRFLACNCVLFS